MATYNQIPSLPIPGADVSFKNYSTTTDIAAGVGVLFDGTNKGDANNPPGVVPVATSGGQALTAGITLETIKAGGVGRVRLAGGAVATANGTVNPGTICMLDDTAGHEGQIIAGTGVNETIGKALSAAVAGDPVQIWVDITGRNG